MNDNPRHFQASENAGMCQFCLGADASKLGRYPVIVD